MKEPWGIILGASSGMGLATAKKLADAGMNLILIHRDRRAILEEINGHFDSMKEQVKLMSFNTDALDKDKRTDVLEEISNKIGSGKISLLLHSVAKGNLKLMGKQEAHIPATENEVEKSFSKAKELAQEVDYGYQALNELDFSLTTQAMATSMLSWTQDILTRDLFAEKARVIGLTSEGHQRVWPGYGAVAVAKSSLETLSKYMAVEFAGVGLRTNVIQAGITPTPSMEMIPGSDLMKGSAKFRNPYGRLTTSEDVANVVYLLSKPEADWINGTTIVVDGGEHLT
ncbi:MAG: SDR family oxidoreductase [Cytophagales bacterium]|nr:SDR family oxidoreductase [Cytophagales bacterium]